MYNKRMLLDWFSAALQTSCNLNRHHHVAVFNDVAIVSH